MANRTSNFRTVLIAFIVGMLGAATSLVISRTWSNDGPLPIAISEASANQYPPEYSSFLEIGSRFPEEVYYTSAGTSESFYEIFKSGPTLLLLWSPLCEPCIEQDTLWKRTMRPSLVPNVREVLCLPLHYRDSASLPQAFTEGRMVVFFDDKQFEEDYRLLVLPTIVSLDPQGFITAIQYGYSGAFTKDLIEAVTKYEVGPCLPVVRKKTEK